MRALPWLTSADEVGEASLAPAPERPEIETAGVGLKEMAEATWQAIFAANDPPRLYRFGTALAWITDDPRRVEVLGRDHLRHHLAEVARFTSRHTPTVPPLALAVDCLAVPHGDLPRLQRLVRAPVFTADGQLLALDGYDRASGLYLALPATLALPAVAAAPTATMLAEARALLLTEWLGDFPFANAADRAHAVALALTPLLREWIAQTVPFWVISKPTPGSGASLLVRTVSLILEGAPIAAGTFSRDAEEMRKRITAVLRRAPSMVCFDNVQPRWRRRHSLAVAFAIVTPSPSVVGTIVS
jgi:hypothetical protein